jgi:hypothetical protein
MPIIQEESLISTNAHTVSCEIAGEAVILDLASGQYFALNPIGTQVWQRLQTPCTLASLCEGLLAEYEVTADQCKADILPLLNQLADHGLVKVEACSPK